MEFPQKRKRESNSQSIELKSYKRPQFYSFRNIFNIQNQKPFYSISTVQPIIDSTKIPEFKVFKQHIHYMSSNQIFYEKYMMNDIVVFEITLGSEELIISRLNKSKVRKVYVNEKKRIENYYDRYGKEKQLLCYSEDGKVIFERKILIPHQYDIYVSYLYDSTGSIIRCWNEYINERS